MQHGSEDKEIVAVDERQLHTFWIGYDFLEPKPGVDAAEACAQNDYVNLFLHRLPLY